MHCILDHRLFFIFYIFEALTGGLTMSTSAEYVTSGASAQPCIAAREPVIETRGLRKEFDGFVAVAGVDLRFAGTGVFGIIGPNGAGKTTFFNLLSSFLKPSAGKVLFHD